MKIFLKKEVIIGKKQYRKRCEFEIYFVIVGFSRYYLFENE